MDVAQALSQYEEHARRSSVDAVSPTTPRLEEPPKADEPKEEAEVVPRLDVKSLVSNWGKENGTPSPVSPGTAEKRKSSYEKYSAFALPPLLEEKTPVTSPANTLGRHAAPPVISEEKESSVKPADPPRAPTPDSPTSEAPESLPPPPVAEPETAKTEANVAQEAPIEVKETVVDPYVHFGNSTTTIKAQQLLILA